MSSAYKSIQYWYLDEAYGAYGSVDEDDGNGNGFRTTKDGDGLLHFVFGINLSEDSNAEKIYISIIKHRNTAVYDDKHKIAGKVKNCANDSSYGTQTYEEE